jgi:hypothetical protein
MAPHCGDWFVFGMWHDDIYRWRRQRVMTSRPFRFTVFYCHLYDVRWRKVKSVKCECLMFIVLCRDVEFGRQTLRMWVITVDTDCDMGWTDRSSNPGWRKFSLQTRPRAQQAPIQFRTASTALIKYCWPRLVSVELQLYRPQYVLSLHSTILSFLPIKCLWNGVCESQIAWQYVRLNY